MGNRKEERRKGKSYLKRWRKEQELPGDIKFADPSYLKKVSQRTFKEGKRRSLTDNGHVCEGWEEAGNIVFSLVLTTGMVLSKKGRKKGKRLKKEEKKRKQKIRKKSKLEGGEIEIWNDCSSLEKVMLIN